MTIQIIEAKNIKNTAILKVCLYRSCTLDFGLTRSHTILIRRSSVTRIIPYTKGLLSILEPIKTEKIPMKVRMLSILLSTSSSMAIKHFSSFQLTLPSLKILLVLSIMDRLFQLLNQSTFTPGSLLLRISNKYCSSVKPKHVSSLGSPIAALRSSCHCRNCEFSTLK